jgi:hypothetical protein
MADWWMLSGTTSTEAGADQPVMQGQAVVTQAEIVSCGVGTAELADGAVTTAKITALNVTSEKASANVVRRTASVMVGSTSGETFSASTGLALWTAPVPVTITAIRVTPLAAWTMATCGEMFTFWSCEAGYLCTYCASSTSVLKTVGDVNSCFTLISTGVTLAACETLRLKVALAGTTSCAQTANVQIDYVTSG